MKKKILIFLQALPYENNISLVMRFIHYYDICVNHIIKETYKINVIIYFKMCI